MNFNSIAETSYTNQSSKSLKPYGIYKVSLTKIELKDIQGVKDPSAIYHTIHLEFTGRGEDEGSVYQQNLFIPSSEEDNVRPVSTNSSGHEYQRPSRFDNYQYTLMQIVETINPKGAAVIKTAAREGKIKTMETFNNLIIKALTGKEDVVTSLKLVGRNVNGTVYAQLPNSCGINKEGKVFATNFIGDNLFFSNYEQQQADAYKNARPTKMSDNLEDTPDTPDSADNLDLDDLL